MASALVAQWAVGPVPGPVTDDSGAVVPHAKITVTNQGENASHALSADGQGNFEALNLKAGTYTVTAEAAGFKTFRSSDLELAARQTLRINVRLEVGSVTE